MKRLITLTILSIGLCLSGSIALADQDEDQSSNTEDNQPKPTNILQNVKQRLNNSKELEQTNLDRALDNDLPENSPSEESSAEHNDDD